MCDVSKLAIAMHTAINAINLVKWLNFTPNYFLICAPHNPDKWIT